MALGRAFSVAVRGLDGQIVEIEADITSGLPGVHLVGLPDAALQESRDRVRAAITNCGNSWPHVAPHAGAVAGDAAENGIGLRHRAGRGRPCRRSGRPRGDSWRRRCCWASWRWTGGSGRCAGCCRPCWPPNATAGRPSWFRWTTWPRPAWSTASTSGGCAPWGNCSSWLGGSARLDDRITAAAPDCGAARRIWPTWWGRRKRGSRSRWPRPGPIT